MCEYNINVHTELSSLVTLSIKVHSHLLYNYIKCMRVLVFNEIANYKTDNKQSMYLYL